MTPLRLKDLLNVIHQDNGDYTAKVGDQRSILDAMDTVRRLRYGPRLTTPPRLLSQFLYDAFDAANWGDIDPYLFKDVTDEEDPERISEREEILKVLKQVVDRMRKLHSTM